MQILLANVTFMMQDTLYRGGHKGSCLCDNGLNIYSIEIIFIAKFYAKHSNGSVLQFGYLTKFYAVPIDND